MRLAIVTPSTRSIGVTGSLYRPVLKLLTSQEYLGSVAFDTQGNTLGVDRGLDKHLGPSDEVFVLVGCQIPTFSPYGLLGVGT